MYWNNHGSLQLTITRISWFFLISKIHFRNNNLMKRLIICCDGTWQTLSNPYPTNVVKLTQQLNPLLVMEPLKWFTTMRGTLETDWISLLVVLPLAGVLTRLSRVLIGSFAWTTVLRTRDELYLFGFSRGAYTVRSLAGLMSCSGIVSRSDIRDTWSLRGLSWEEWRTAVQEVSSFDSHLGRVPITLLGCWDTGHGNTWSSSPTAD